MEITHDQQADAVYIHLSTKPYAYGIDLDNERRVDFADDNTPVGVEFLCVSNGVDVTGLPHYEDIAGRLESQHILTYRLEQFPATGIHAQGMRLLFAGLGDEVINVYEEERDTGEVFNVQLKRPQTSSRRSVKVLP